MGLNLIMPRVVYTEIQKLCVEYEEKFKEKVATASVINALLAEALIHRGLIPSDFLVKQYGCENPIDMGFTSKARNEKPQYVIEQKKRKLQQIEKILTEAYKQWDKLKPSAQAYHLKTAQEHSDLPIAQLILKKEGVFNEIEA